MKTIPPKGILLPPNIDLWIYLKWILFFPIFYICPVFLIILSANDKDQTRFVLDGHPIPIEYENLTKAYKLRAK